MLARSEAGMRDFLLTVVLLGAVPVAFFMPYIGILFWSLIGYLNPHRYTWGFAGTFPFAAVIGGATLLGLLFSKEEKHFPRTALTTIWLVFTAWISFTALFALYPESAYAKWIITMKIMLMSFVTLLVMARRERLDLLIWVIVLSLGFYGSKGGVFTFTHETGGSMLVAGPENSFIGDNNSLALALVMVLPLMYFLQQSAVRRSVRWCLWGAMALSAVAIIGTHSRGAALGLASVGFMGVLASRYKVRALVALSLIVTVGYAFAPLAWKERIATIQTYEQDASAMSRITAWHTAYNLASNRLLGGGFDAMQTETYIRYSPDRIPERALNTHSIYFEVLAEHGFIGLAFFLLLGALALRTASWVGRSTQGHDELTWARNLTAMIRLSLIGYFVNGAFLNLAYFDLYYHLVGIMVLTRVIVERSLATGVGMPIGGGTATGRVSPGTV